MSKNQTIIDIDCLYKDEKFMPLLPLLDLTYPEAKDTYPGITQDNFHDLILYALDWQLEDHWQSKSMHWLENGLDASDSILNKISGLAGGNRMSTSLKKRMHALLEKNSVDTLV